MNAVKGRIRCIQKRIQKEVGKKRAVILVSGGIDSSVCAILSNSVISKQVYPLYIRTGFNLDQEEKELIRLFSGFNIKIKILDKEKEYFAKLHHIENPVKRRRMFGVISLENIRKYAKSVGATILINGVNKNDIKISNTRTRTNKLFELKLVEPIADLYKTEVKGIAKQIGLNRLAYKQHIPGPGLSIRIAGRITKEKLNLLKEINKLVNKKTTNRRNLWYFPFLLNERLDNKYLIILRFVSSKEGFKAEPIYDKKLMNLLANDILKKFHQIGRVFFDISPKPPATIEFM